jgi:uncharacterized protein HemX
MARLSLIISFLMTGVLPLCLGLYLTHRNDYFVAVACFLISVCGFQQVYYTLNIQESLKSFKDKIAEKEKELEEQTEDFLRQKKQMKQNMADFFGKKMEQQEQVIARQKKELAQAAKFLEHKNKEIKNLRDYYD